VLLGSAARDGITGKLLSAVWDLWADLPAYRADLDKNDVYTLRRITPADRGFDWGGRSASAGRSSVSTEPRSRRG
jgi:hypothetical protein